MKTEIRIAKIVTAILIAVTIFMVSRSNAGEIADLFKHYNKKLSKQQALSLEAIVNEAGGHFGVSPNLIASIIVVESSARPNAISKGGDYGLMQVRYKVHKDKVKNAKDLLKPEINIKVGTRIYVQCYNKTKSVYGALVRYSGGNKTMARKVIKVMKGLNNGSTK